ncbi:MAG: hypothetical protein AAF629_28890 [Chloroflexota bacterium]
MSSLFSRLQDEIDSQREGIFPTDLLELPPELAKIIKKIIRQNGMKLAQVAEELEQSPETAQETINGMVEKGYVRQIEVKGEIWYKARFARKRGRALSSSFWSALDDLSNTDS